MYLFIYFILLLLLFFFSDGGRELYFPAYYFYPEKRLERHVIKRGPVKDLDECEHRCYLDANCVSLNIKNKDHDSGTHECELNNSTHLEHDEDLKDNQLYYYRGAEVSQHYVFCCSCFCCCFFLTFSFELFNKPIYTKHNRYKTSSPKS